MIREYIVEITNEVMPDAFERFENEYTPEQELIRCKDCKYYDPDCQTCDNGLDGIFIPTWFCPDGKRKD